jgi:MATE family multidrug resistance protein
MSQIPVSDHDVLVPSFKQSWVHSKLLGLALPLIITNVSLPLIGLVDTAVLGHMGQVEQLAGASVAAFILTQLYWICGFLRMSASGLSAQAKGAKDGEWNAKVLQQGLLLSMLLAFAVLLLQQWIFAAGMALSEFSGNAQQASAEYFNMRVWGAPAVLMNLTLMGWLVGQQRNRMVMIIQISANLLNLILNLFFVYVLDMQVAGVALASVIAEYTILLVALLVSTGLIKFTFPLSLNGFSQLLKLNHHILIRNLALQFCLAFVTFQGARFGDNIAALNSILMQFFVLIALGLDGIANATEALVGQSKGAKKGMGVWRWTLIGLFWSAIGALLYTLLFALLATDIVRLLTDQPELISLAVLFLPLMVALPLIAHWSFLFDAVFIGLTRAKAMQHSMLVSALVFYLTWLGLSNQENYGLWLAMLVFLAMRGLSMGGYFIYLHRKRELAL